MTVRRVRNDRKTSSLFVKKLSEEGETNEEIFGEFQADFTPVEYELEAQKCTCAGREEITINRRGHDRRTRGYFSIRHLAFSARSSISQYRRIIGRVFFSFIFLSSFFFFTFLLSRSARARRLLNNFDW